MHNLPILHLSGDLDSIPWKSQYFGGKKKKDVQIRHMLFSIFIYASKIIPPFRAIVK